MSDDDAHPLKRCRAIGKQKVYSEKRKTFTNATALQQVIISRTWLILKKNVFLIYLNCARDLYIFFQFRCSCCCCCNIRDKSQVVKTGQQNYYSICFCYFFKYYFSEYYVMGKSHVLVI